MSGSAGELSDQAWDKVKPPATMNRRRLEGTNIALLVLTSVVFVSRVVVRIARRKRLELHGLFCWLSYICYVCMWVMYYYENDPLYRAEGVQRGEIPPYPEIIHDAGMIYRWMTAGQLLFYSSLTFVKLSLLFLYRQLLEQAPHKFAIMWWGILAFCILSFIGASMTTIFVCDDQKAKYNQGICAKPNEQKRAEFSLWFAYAVDVASDLAVMFLPFRMTWSLQMPRTKKLGVFVLFGSGWVCILFATLRVVQVGTKDGVPKVPDPKWLQMWTVIETSMAVIIGCAPAFAAVIHKQFGSLAVSYDARGNANQPAQEVQMASIQSGSANGSANGSKSGSSHRPKGRDDALWTQSNDSEEALADEPPVMRYKGTRIRR